VGKGPFVRALRQVAREREWKFDIMVCDIDPNVPGMKYADQFKDVTAMPPCAFLEWAAEWEGEPWDLVVGNPPFSVVEPGKKRGPVVAHLHIQAARKIAKATCLVTRVGLLTTSDDRPFALEEPPNHRFDAYPRPSFTIRGTDACEYLGGLWDDRMDRVQIAGVDCATSEILQWKEIGRWPRTLPGG